MRGDERRENNSSRRVKTDQAEKEERKRGRRKGETNEGREEIKERERDIRQRGI